MSLNEFVRMVSNESLDTLIAALEKRAEEYDTPMYAPECRLTIISLVQRLNAERKIVQSWRLQSS